MECPFCGKEMKKGILSGDGRSRVRWHEDGEKIIFTDNLTPKGCIDAKYSLAKFKIESFYCAKCKKMILDTEVQA